MARSIFYFTDSDAFGGAEEALLSSIERLDRQLWKPTLLYHLGDGIRPLVECAQALGVATCAVDPMPLGLDGARRVPAFAAYLRRRRPSVFHAHLSWPLAAKYPLAAAVLARLPAIVATVHLFPQLDIDRSSRVQEFLLGRLVDRYIAVSEDVAARLVDAFGWPRDKIRVVRNGIDTAQVAEPPDDALRRRLAGAPSRRVVLAVARLVPQKALDVLVRAATKVDASFVVAGDGPERIRLEALAIELGVAERVTFVGHRSDVPALLAASDVFVLPSLYEGTSLALLKAMAAGKAVIASAVGGNDEIVVDGESGILVPVRDSDALARAIERVLDDDALRARLAAGACVRAEQFSAREAADAVVRVYEDILGGHAS